MSDLKWTPVTIRLGQVKPWQDNPRLSTKAQAERLIQSERELGQVQTIAIGPAEEDGKFPLYDGHQRYAAWFTVKGAAYELTALQSNRPLTEDERRKMAILLHTASGGWAWDKMAGWQVGELKEWGLVNQENIKGWNNDANNVKELLEAEKETVDAEPQTDRAAELLEKWQVKTGDLWQIGEHRLICGDCTDAAVVARVMGGEKADIEVHDPPYGMDLDTDYSKMPSTKAEGNKEYERIIGDDRQFDYKSIINLDCKEQFMFGADYYAKTLPDCGSWLVWDKRVEDKFDAMIGSAFELVWSKTKHKREIIRHNNTLFSGEAEAKNKLHPTTKPTKVIEWIISKYGGDVVADFFLGSGTTLVACQNLSRRGRAVEISPAYCAVTLQRMSDAFPGIEIRKLE